MWFVHHFLIVTVFICEASARNFCEQKNEEPYFCRYDGEVYPQLCPQLTTRCMHGGRICICQRGYFRRQFWHPCVTKRECVVPDPTNSQIVSTKEPLDEAGDEETTQATAQENNDASPNASASNDEMFPCIWCTALRPSETLLEQAQGPIGRSINSRSLVQTRHETVPRSIRHSVKGRSDLIIVDSTFTEWKNKKHNLILSVVIEAGGRYVLKLNPYNPKSLPPDADPTYDILHANTHCIIFGRSPLAGEKTDCFFWTTQSRTRTNNFECEFVWEHYCRFPTEVPYEGSDCV
ncbi:uncharacterized protein [Dermacentor albipictus]|uniref:uncharacterized protein n=1 Tax=Dermacentor albipictus TaxID=60249 RepID=UPI0038FC50C8